jgi:hypothetical protein
MSWTLTNPCQLLTNMILLHVTKNALPLLDICRCTAVIGHATLTQDAAGVPQVGDHQLVLGQHLQDTRYGLVAGSR